MKSTILVVEDDQQIQRLYGDALRKHQFAVAAATTVKEALAVLFRQKIDLIILDIMLPGGMNGFDLLEKVKNQSQFAKIPVIVLTNLDGEEKVARDIGVNDYVVKANTTVKEIIEKVNHCLSQAS